MHLRDEINLRVLRGHEASIRGIRKQTPYVVLYNYSISEGSWSKLPFEGTLFVYETQARLCGYRILNRLSLDCFSRNIESDQDIMETEGYIIHRTGEDIWGIWIWDSKDRSELFSAMQRAGRRSRKTVAGKSKPAVERTKERPSAPATPELAPVVSIKPEVLPARPQLEKMEDEQQPVKMAKTSSTTAPSASKASAPKAPKERHASNARQSISPKRKVAAQAPSTSAPRFDLTQKEPEHGFSDDGPDAMLSDDQAKSGIRYDPDSFDRGLSGHGKIKNPRPKKQKERQPRVPTAQALPKAQPTRPKVDLTMKEPEEGFSETEVPALLSASKQLDVNAMFAQAARGQTVQSDYDSDMYKR